MHKTQSSILYEDEALVLVNKAPGELTIPDRHHPEYFNLQHWLQERYGRIWVVHRLDRDTSGILCFARTAEAHRHLSRQFEERTVNKTYLALVDGIPYPQEGSIDRPIGPHPSQAGKMTVVRKGKNALTEYRCVEIFRQFSLLELQLHTGRTHQVRVHLAYLGHPLIVDPLYGKRDAFYLSEVKGRHYRLGKNEEERPLLTRHPLHAFRLGFVHPLSSEERRFEAPPAKDFTALLRQLRKWGRN
jgi:RluA family pseudouridine synthase